MMAVIPALVALAVVYGRFTKSLTKQYQDALAKAAGLLVLVLVPVLYHSILRIYFFNIFLICVLWLQSAAGSVSCYIATI